MSMQEKCKHRYLWNGRIILTIIVVEHDISIWNVRFKTWSVSIKIRLHGKNLLFSWSQYSNEATKAKQHEKLRSLLPDNKNPTFLNCINVEEKKVFFLPTKNRKRSLKKKKIFFLSLFFTLEIEISAISS